SAPPGNTHAPGNEPRSGRSNRSTSGPPAASRSSTTVAATPSISSSYSSRMRPPDHHPSDRYACRMSTRLEQVTELATRVLAPNPGPMTLEGTNSYLLGTGRSRVVVDPGPLDDAHLELLAAHPVDVVLIT